MNLEHLPPNTDKLYIQHPRTSVFYMLPKIHKPNNPVRPIVSAISCPTAQIASYLDRILTPINQQLPTYIKDTSHTLRLFKQFKFNGRNRYLFTMDVKSLYTCIPHADGLKALKFFLERRPKQHPPSNTLLCLAELVLTNNAFSFNSNFYLQTSGVAMGSKLGPSYACLFVGHQEHLISNSYNGPYYHVLLSATWMISQVQLRYRLKLYKNSSNLPTTSTQLFNSHTTSLNKACLFSTSY